MKPTRKFKKLPHPNQYPKELVLNGLNWRIVWVDRIDGPDTLGLCDSENKTIQLMKGQNPKERLVTFIHEILHLAEYSAGCKLTHKQVYQLSEALADLLILNF